MGFMRDNVCESIYRGGIGRMISCGIEEIINELHRACGFSIPVYLCEPRPMLRWRPPNWRVTTRPVEPHQKMAQIRKKGQVKDLPLFEFWLLNLGSNQGPTD
jgi:hypothetical protein